MARKKSKSIDNEFNVTEGVSQKITINNDANLCKDKYMSILRLERKQKNGLLGTFDSNGNYKINDPKIFESLVNIPKKFQEKEDDVVYASVQQDNFVLNFKIKFEIDVSFSSATLFLIETEQGVEENVKHITELDHYLNVYSATFQEEVFKAWKVWKEEEIYEKDDYLFEYLRFQHQELLFNRELTEILSQLYLMRMLKVLEQAGEIGQKLLLEYKVMVEARQEKDPAFKQSNTALKEILDSLMIKYGAFDEIIKIQDGASVIAGYAEPLMRLQEKVADKIEPVVKQESKEEKKPSKETKKGKVKAKSKSKGSAPKLYKFDAAKAYKTTDFGKYKEPKDIFAELGKALLFVPLAISAAKKIPQKELPKQTPNSPALKNSSISSLRDSVERRRHLGSSTFIDEKEQIFTK